MDLRRIHRTGLRTFKYLFCVSYDMAKVGILWSCPQCDEQTHFKGLCRKCTEYNVQGEPVKPVHRVRLNHTPTEQNQYVRTKTDFVNSRRRQPSKKQLETIKEMLNSQSKEIVGADEEDDFRPVGQGITDDSIEGEEE